MVTSTADQKRPGWGSARLALREALPSYLNPGVQILAYLTVIGALAGIWRLFSGLGAATNLTDGIPWGIWIGFDFSLIAISGAGFTMAGLVYVFRQEKFRPALRPAVLTGLLGYTAVLALLILDLGRPDRFYHFLIYWNLHSPLFEISWCVLLYTTVLAIEVSPQIFERLNKPGPVRVVHAIIVPLAIIAVTLSSLHQSTLGTLYLNMPYRLNALWYTPLLPLLFFTSSVSTGLSVAIITYKLATRFTGQQAQPRVARGLGSLVAGVLLFYLVLKLGDLILSGKTSLLVAFDRMSLLMWIELIVGVLAPLAIFLAPSVRRTEKGQWAGAILVIVGTLISRFDATLFAQTAPPGATYVPHVVEWMTTIGVVAAAALAWYLGARLLAVFEKPSGHH
jgi:Ni/Fe-hydrogenase subunit HybB-like protein